MELVWSSLHEAVSRNHECAGLDDLVEFAEGYLEERQPFGPKLGEVYDRRERPPPRGRASVHLSRGVKVELSGAPIPFATNRSKGASEVLDEHSSTNTKRSGSIEEITITRKAALRNSSRSLAPSVLFFRPKPIFLRALERVDSLTETPAPFSGTPVCL